MKGNKMIQIGWNFNTFMNNSDQNLDPDSRLPNGYFFSNNSNLNMGLYALEPMHNSMSAQFLRTFIYLAEHSDNNTPWLHIPLTDDEIDRIEGFVSKCYSMGIMVELVWGALWDALWICPYDRPNKFTDLDLLIDAHVDSMNRLVSSIKKYNNWIIDLWNEKSIYDEQDPLFNQIYKFFCAELSGNAPQARRTVSVMIGQNGEYADAKTQLDRVYRLGYDPDFIELHWNTATSYIIEKNVGKVVSAFRNYRKPLYFGEVDSFTDVKTLEEVRRQIEGTWFKPNLTAPYLPLIAFWQKSGLVPTI